MGTVTVPTFIKRKKMIVEHIKKQYKEKKVLSDITFEAEKGECIGILGGNGSGKSTLLNVLSGIIGSNGGKFLYNDVDLLKNEKVRSKVLGYVTQGTPLLEELNAKDNLSLWYSKADMEKELESGVLGMLGINEFIKVPVYKMSGGMKKRLSIGCAVAHKPEILLLDEPSAALDLICKERIANYLMEYKENGGTIILATHDIHELSLCDKLYILKDGTLVPYEFDGDVHKLVGRL